MKKNFNVIQIKGIRGLIIAGLVVTCLAAGFIVFPGWVAMQLWNLFSTKTLLIPTIGLFQGVLLWGIVTAAYFTFRKDKVVVCLKSPQGLSEDELKAVLANMKKNSQEDLIMQAMMRARDIELKENKSAENIEQDALSSNESSGKLS